MSTNYYHRPKGATDYNDDDHIGLSVSTMFTFCSKPEQNLITLEDWKRKLFAEDIEIVDEYNKRVTKERFFTMVASDAAAAKNIIYRNSPILPPNSRPGPDMVRYRDAAGNLFDCRDVS